MYPPNLRRMQGRLQDCGPTVPTASPPSGYELLGVLGRGGMGVVYQARQRGLNRIVALKMLLGGAHASPAVLERFRREAESVARLSHPGIVQVYEVGESGGLPYISLEYVGGGSLADATGGMPMPARLAAHLVASLADAVQAAHAAGIVHRDLKPSNVLLATPTGRPPKPGEWSGVVAKICDFGLAKRLDAADATAATRTGEALGTISYMAPEQLEGSRQVGPAADIYALGAILYDLLTGRPPFLGESELNIVWMLMSQEPVSVRQLSPKVPRDLETICHKCLAKEPTRRYSTAGDLASDLRRFLDGKPILARRASILEQASKWVRRHPVVAVLGVALLVTVAAGLSGVIWKWTESERLRREAEAQRSESDRRASAAAAQRRRAERAEAEARQRANDETAAYQAALQASRLAEQRGREARDAAREARTAAAEASRRLYHAQITVAQSRLQANDVAGCMAVLRECNPPRWEWHHLMARCHPESWLLYHNQDTRALWVNALVFSPDGERLFSGAGVARFLKVDQHSPGEILVWDMRTGRLDEPVTASLNAGLSPNRKSVLGLARHKTGLLAESNRDGVRLWEPTTQGGYRLRWHVPTPTEQHVIQFSPDGARVLVGQDLLSVAEGRRMRLLTLSSARFAPDGRIFGWQANESGEYNFCILSGDGERVLLSVSDQLPRLGAAILAPGRPTISPDGHRIAYLAGRQVRVLDTADGRLVQVLRSGAGEVIGPVFSPNGRHLASGGHDLVVRVWDAETGDLVAQFRGHGHPLTALTFGHDGRHMASGDFAGCVRVWDLAAPVERQSLLPVGPVESRMCLDAIAFTDDGKRLVGLHALGEIARSGDPRTGQARPQLHVWNVETGAPLASARLDCYTENLVPTRRAAFSDRGRLLAAVGRDVRTVGVWELEKLTEANAPFDPDTLLAPRVVLSCAAPVLSVAISANGRRVFVGGVSNPEQQFDNRIWTLDDAPKSVPVATPMWVTDASFTPDGSAVVLGGVRPEDGRPILAVFDGSSGQRLRELLPIPAVQAVTVSADGRLLAAAGQEHVFLFAMADGRLVTRCQVDAAYALAFMSDGSRLMAVSRDVIRLFDTENGAAVLSLEGVGQREGDRAFNPSGAVSSDGQRIAAGRTDGSVRVWASLPSERVIVDPMVEVRIGSASPGVSLQPERAQADRVTSVRAERGAVWHIATANEMLAQISVGREAAHRSSTLNSARFHLEASTRLPVLSRWLLLERARLWTLLGETARAGEDRAAASLEKP